MKYILPLMQASEILTYRFTDLTSRDFSQHYNMKENYGFFFVSVK